MKNENKILLKRIITGLVALSLIGVGVIYPISSSLDEPLEWWVILLILLGVFIIFIGFMLLFNYLARKQNR